MLGEVDNPEIEELTNTLLEVAAETWRYRRLLDRILQKLDAGEQGKYRGQIRGIHKKIEDSLASSGMRIVNVEGHLFDPGMAAKSLNIEEFDPGDKLVVDQMIEPIIMGLEGVVRTGTVTLRKVDS